MTDVATTKRRDLARVTVVGPDRRLDVAAPTDIALCDLLPGFVARLGDGLGDDGEKHGGWRLRTDAGEALDPARTLAQQQVRDGQRLHLVPGDEDWPEVDYDDVVEAIAQGGRDTGRGWRPATTRATGMVAMVAVLVVGLAVLTGAGLSNGPTGAVVAVTGVVLLLAGVVAGRPLNDSGVGALLALTGVLHLALAAAFVSSPSTGSRWELDTGDLLLASCALVLGSLLAHVGVGAWLRVWSAGVVVGSAGLLASALSILGLDRVACAAAVVAVGTAALAVFPLLAMRLGRVPVPVLPQTPDDLLADQPRPDPTMVRSAVLRADELLTGFLAGSTVNVVVCQLVLLQDGRRTAVALALVTAATFALRAQLFPTVRHRLPLLVVGAVGALAVVLAIAVAAASVPGLVLVPTVVLLAALGVLAATASGRGPALNPYLLRAADLLEVGLLIAVLPLAASLLGLYAYARGLGG